MSRYAGSYSRGGSYQTSADNRQQAHHMYTDNEYVNEYDQNYSTTGGNSYDTTEAYSDDTYQDGSSSNQTHSADYDNNDTDYGYDDQSSQDGAYKGHNIDTYEEDAYVDQVRGTCQEDQKYKPVTDYHNYSSGTISTYSSNDANVEDFGNRSLYSQTRDSGAPYDQTKGSGAHNYNSQTRGSGAPYGQTRGSGAPYDLTRGSGVPYNQTRGSRAPYSQTRGSRVPYSQMRGSGRGQNRFPRINERGTGRGHFNPPKNTTSPSQGPGQKYGQFGRYIPNTGEGHVQPDKKDPNKGQFNLPTGSSNSTVTGQFGLPIETETPEADNQLTTTKSNPPSTAQPNLPPTTNPSSSEQMTEKDINEEADSDSSDEDTEFCKYCKLKFTTPKAYHMHTRGLQHTTLVMQAKSEKGDVHYQKEKVDASVLEVNIPAPHPEVKPEGEDNCMSLEEIMDSIKHKTHPEGRDLHPDDIGKSVLPSAFDCALCNIKCTGAAAFRMHIDGKQHKNNIEAAKKGSILKKRKPMNPGIMVETKERPSKFSEMAKDNHAPMLGLEYVTEFQKTDIKAAPRYVCNLCESKCDGSTIIPHLIGLKHRLHFMQIKNPLMYEHLTKYNSKRKKSEMNANLEDFARDIEEKNGRGEVKIKVELDNYENEEELKESMLRHSKALAEKVKELEEGKIDSFADVKSLEPTPKKPRLAKEVAADRRAARAALVEKEPSDQERSPYDDSRGRHPLDDRRRQPNDDRRDHPLDDRRRQPNDDRRDHPLDDRRRQPNDDRRDHPLDDRRRQPYDDRRDHPLDDRRRSPFDDRRDHRLDDRRRSPFDDRRDHRLDDRRRSPFDDRRDHRLDDRRRSPFDDRRDHRLDDRRSPFDDRRDHPLHDRRSRRDDPMHERMYDERKHLDSLMAKRHHLDDPDAERRRVDDIVERRRCIDDLERDRFSDILERRKRLQESDVDYLRMKRFSERETAASSSPSLSTDEEKRLQDLLARRRALVEETKPRTPVTETIPQTTVTETNPRISMMETNPKRIKTEIEALQDKLATHRSSDPNMAAMQIKAAMALREEAAKSPNVNIGEIMSNLSSSIITTDDDASMSLQITNALTQALLKHRLHIASRELSTIAESRGPLLEQKVAEVTLPGLGTSTTSSSVPVFLRTSQHNTLSTNLPQYNYTATTQSSVNALYPAYSQRQPTEAALVASVSAPKAQSQNESLFDTSNIDQPQKMLLESIRKQTEILKQKIKGSSAATDVNASSATINVQSQSKHVPSSTQAIAYANLYASFANSSANPVAASYTSSLANLASESYSSSSTSRAAAGTNHVTSTANQKSPSHYSAQYYKHNYHSIPPNAAPETVPSASHRDKRASVPVQATQTNLPTNDLPLLRRKRHR